MHHAANCILVTLPAFTLHIDNAFFLVLHNMTNECNPHCSFLAQSSQDAQCKQIVCMQSHATCSPSRRMFPVQVCLQCTYVSSTGVPVRGMSLRPATREPASIMTAPAARQPALIGMLMGTAPVCRMCAIAAAGYMTPIADTPKLIDSSMHVGTCHGSNPTSGYVST